jgi:hypothetical protein
MPFYDRIFSVLIVLGSLGAIAAGTGSAAAAGAADAPKVRLAVFYSIDGYEVVRSKGSDKVTSPDIGVYCVKTSAGGGIANARNTVPVVSIEYATAKGQGANAVAVVATASPDCPNAKRWIGVRTYDLSGDPTDDASWNLIVP